MTFFPDTCPAGYLNDLGELTCRECGYGRYQPEENQIYCQSCNNGLTTDVPHATNSTQCTGTSLFCGNKYHRSTESGYYVVQLEVEFLG